MKHGAAVVRVPLSVATFEFPGLRDPDAGPPVPGRDWAAIAETSYRQALVLAELARDYAGRLMDGREWFRTHDASDDAYGHAIAIYGACEAAYRCYARGIWFHVCCTYAATVHAGDAWTATVAPDLDTRSPQAIWRAVMGDVTPAGHWPLEASDSYVEGRLGQVPTWDLIELRRNTRPHGGLTSGAVRT